jgi:Ni,Fe-hydrogenase I cytochrome b subunit
MKTVLPEKPTVKTVDEPTVPSHQELDAHHIVAKRYTLLQRTQHWGNSLIMGIFFITGFEILLKKFFTGDSGTTQLIHVYSGYYIMVWSVILYVFVILWEKKLKDIIPTPRDILDLGLILLCGLGLIDDKWYPHYDYYNPMTKKYHNKYHPVQKFLAFGNFFMLVFIGITGFALLGEINPGSDGFGDLIYTALTPLIDMGWDLRFTHFLVFIYFLMSTAMHTYFALLKSNRGRFQGMVGGKEHIEFK